MQSTPQRDAKRRLTMLQEQAAKLAKNFFVKIKILKSVKNDTLQQKKKEKNVIGKFQNERGQGKSKEKSRSIMQVGK